MRSAFTHFVCQPFGFAIARSDKVCHSEPLGEESPGILLIKMKMYRQRRCIFFGIENFCKNFSNARANYKQM